MKLEQKIENLKERLIDNAKSYVEALKIYEEVKKLLRSAVKKERAILTRQFIEIRKGIRELNEKK